MRVGPWWIHPYTLRILGAAVVALLWLRWRAPQRKDIGGSHFGWWLAIVTAGALVVGRAGYAWEHIDYFRQQPRDVIDVREMGGLSGPWALVGGIAGIYLWALLSHRRLCLLVSFLTPAILWIAAASWWGCRDVGCAWGKAMPEDVGILSWIITEGPDLYHIVTPRYAVRTLGALWAVAMAALAWLLNDRGILALALYLIGAAGLNTLRGDPALRIYGLRISTLIQVGAALGLTGYYSWSVWRARVSDRGASHTSITGAR